MASTSGSGLGVNGENRREKGDLEKRSNLHEAGKDVIREHVGMNVYSVVL